MNKTFDQVQLTQILYEISMSIGTSLDLRTMIKPSLSTILKKLDCASGGVYQKTQQSDGTVQLEAVYTSPHRKDPGTTFQEAISRLPDSPTEIEYENFLAALPLVEQSEEGHFYHILDLPDFGVLLLVKNGEPLTNHIIQSLTPLLNKLAAAAIGCVNQAELDKFKLGMERSSDAIFLTDPDGSINYVNDAFVKIYGYSKEEAIGKTPRILKSGLITQEQYEYFWQTLISGNIVAGEIINKTKDGRFINVEGNNNPVLDENGQVIGFLAMHRDITKRKATEETLSQSQQSLQVVLENQTTLHEISLELANINDLDELLKQAVFLGREKLGFDRLGLWLIDDNQGTLNGTYGISPEGEIRSEKHNSFIIENEPWIQDFVVDKERLTVREEDDLFEGDQGDQIIGRGWHIIAALWAHGTPIGLFFADNFLSKEPMQPHQPELLSAYGANVAPLIDRMRTAEVLRQSEQALQTILEKQTVLHEVTIELAAIDDIDELSQQAILLGKERLGFERLSLFLYDQQAETVAGTYGIGPGGEMRSESENIFVLNEDPWMHDTLYNKNRLIVDKDINIFEGKDIIGRGWHLTTALWTQDTPIGLFFADNLLSQEPLQPYQPELLATYSAELAHLINRIRTEKALRESEQSMHTFLEKMQSLHEISLHLSTIENQREMLWEAFSLARSRLGFSRLGLFLLDPSHEFVTGTVGINMQGEIRDEYHIVHNLADERMHRYLFDKERLSVTQDTDLYEDDKVVGRGWNIVTSLWMEGEPIGLLFTDNLLSQEPLQAYHAELLSAFGSIITDLISRNRIQEERLNTQKAIAKRAEELQTVAELSTAVAATADPQKLLQDIVDQAKERFELSHAHIYLIDDSGENLVLAAGAGEVGAIMVKQGHFITLDQQQSLVARAAREKKGIIVNNVFMDLSFLPNPLLPDTRSEMAVPMIVGNQVLGVLDVQAATMDRFTNDDAQIQMTLAAQTAVALQNARQFEQTQLALANANTFRQLVDATSQGIGIFSLKQGETIYANSAMSNMFGITDPEKELYGKALGDFLPEEIRIRYQEEVIPAAMEKGSWEGELWLGDPEQPTYTYENHFLLRDDDGNPTFAAAIVSDITARKASEEAIRENRNLMRAIIDASPDWIIVKSRENRYILVNKAFSNYIGIPVEDMIGKDDIEIGFDEELVRGNPEKGIPGFWPEDQAVMDSGEIFQKDDMLDDFDQIRYNSTVKTPFKNEDGDVTGLVVFVHDITPQKSAEIAMAKRAEELQSVADLSTAFAATSDPQELLQDVVDLTKEHFDLYHAHIYLLDDSGRNLVLTAGAGEAGSKMVAEGFSIPLNQEKSLIARTARNREGIIVNDVTLDPGFLPNKLLPDTRSEMTVPLIAGNNLLGILDVQSAKVDSFTSEDLKIQSTLAAQIAVALENARSVVRTNEALEELNQLTRRLTRESWDEYLSIVEDRETAFAYNLGKLTPVRKGETTSIAEETAVSLTNGNGNGHLSQSLMVHGEAIGHLTVFNEAETQPLDEDAAIIMAAVAEQLSARVENIRLTEQTEHALAQTQEQAHRLGMLNEVSAEMSNVETLNQVFDVVFSRIPDLLKVEHVSLTILQPDGENLEIIGYAGEEMHAPAGTMIQLAETPMAKALQERRIIVSDSQVIGKSIKASMIAPIFSTGRAIGTLNIGSKNARSLTARDENLLQQLATMLSSVIENKQLLAAAQARAERERQVRTITDKIRRGTDREAILNIAQKEIGKLIGANQSAAQLGTKTQLLERIQQTIEQSTPELEQVLNS